MPASPESPCPWKRTKPLVLYVLLGLAGLISSASLLARSDFQPEATPESAHPAPQIQSVLLEVDKIFNDFFETQHIPGLVYGVILDGKLIHARALGFSNLERKTPASRNSAFRIASMTKSFIAMAIFKLRDDGRLALDDPVSKYVPEFRRVKLPTSDSAPVTIRQLMSMTTGLPEDNPWGDRQLAITKTALTKFVEAGLSFSTPPGQQFEYSNLGFVLLGQIVSRGSGVPFQKYVTERILRPLGMLDTRWEFAEVPADKLALGYRWEHDEWSLEPMLHDGQGAACGGLLTTLEDFAKYVEFHLQATPARDDPDLGPVRRATLRELQKPVTVSSMLPRETLLDGHTPNPLVTFYGYGLGWSIDSRGVVWLSHSGGLPGFGSYYRFLPDYGMGVIAFANRTYAQVGPPCSKAINILLEHGSLQSRPVPVSSILQTRADQVRELIVSWDPQLSGKIVAENFFLDRSREDWVSLAHETLAKAGAIRSVGPLVPQNRLRGKFTLAGESGRVEVAFTLTPENVPKVQALRLTFMPNPVDKSSISKP